jgi:hypothetical protein
MTTPSSDSAPRRSPAAKVPVRRIVLIAAYGGALATIAHFAREGRSYYSTPLIERPRHDDYWRLKPGGTTGHALGIVGSSLMIVMLLYSVRKRVKPLRRLGRLASWLDFHIFCGVVGPLLVIFHTSFKVNGLVALSFWSMIAVALSGVLGRYLYGQIPRTRAGDQLSLAEAEEQNRELAHRLREELGMGDEALAELDAMAAGGLGPETGLAAILLRLPLEGVRLRLRLRSFRRRFRGSPRPLLRELARAVRRKALLERRLLLWTRLQRAFHYWHVFHKPFAVVMYVFMLVHVAVAIVTGYGWAIGR